MKTMSSRSAKSRKGEESPSDVLFLSSVGGGTPEDRPGRVPQMTAARGHEGVRTPSGGVEGVIAPDPWPAQPDDRDGKISRRNFPLSFIPRSPLTFAI
jgi:hypothetical protein